MTLSCIVQPEELALSPDEGRFPDPFVLDVAVHPIDQGLSAQGVLRSRVVRECVRCVVEYEELMSVQFTAEYRMMPQPKTQPKKGKRRTALEDAPPEPEVARGGDTDEDDLDRYVMAADRLDLADMLREQIILASPMNPLCRENCLGLCPMCGQNRNQALCDCQEPREANPFAVLRDLQQTPNSEAARVVVTPRKPPKATRD